jgi:putative transposase
MYDVQSLSHTSWECKYHVVWIPECRRKVIYGQIRRHLGEIFRDLAARKGCLVLEGHPLPDHVQSNYAIYHLGQAVIELTGPYGKALNGG